MQCSGKKFDFPANFSRYVHKCASTEVFILVLFLHTAPPLQPGKPCLYLNQTHAIVCLLFPFSHLEITHFIVEINCGACNCSYNHTILINPMDLCKPFELQQNCSCTTIEFTITAYSDAGASEPSVSVRMADGMYCITFVRLLCYILILFPLYYRRYTRVFL